MIGEPLPRRGLLLGGLSAAAAAPFRGYAQTVTALPAPGWREAVVIVPDLAPWIETLSTVGGWECAYRGAPDTSLNAFWSLPAEARTEQALMRNIGTRTGFIRLVKVTGVEQRPIRPDDQAWEAGGIQALDMRVVDMESTRAALHARGWRAPSEPVRYKTYGVEVIEWTPSSPDGVRLALIQRIAPPLQGWPELKRWGRVGNAAITVKDMSAARAFFGGALGMKPGFDSNVVGSGGPNVMGLPWSFAASAQVEIRGFGGDAAGGGSIELIGIPQALGRDYSMDAHPPNLGIAALRFMVDDVEAYGRRLSSVGVSPRGLITQMVGGREALAVQAPDGVRLEFMAG